MHNAESHPPPYAHLASSFFPNHSLFISCAWVVQVLQTLIIVLLLQLPRALLAFPPLLHLFPSLLVIIVARGFPRLLHNSQVRRRATLPVDLRRLQRRRCSRTRSRLFVDRRYRNGPVSGWHPNVTSLRRCNGRSVPRTNHHDTRCHRAPLRLVWPLRRRRHHTHCSLLGLDYTWRSGRRM